jgi:hypothetical protein
MFFRIYLSLHTFDFFCLPTYFLKCGMWVARWFLRSLAAPKQTPNVLDQRYHLPPNRLMFL